jgi:protein O-mannosyl-transferase
MSRRKKSDKKPARHDRLESLIPSGRYLRMLAGAALIALIAVCVYLPSINGSFIMDDDQLLTENDLIKFPGGLHMIWFSRAPADYWPVTNSMLWLEWRLWGMKPTGYHVVSLILHVVETLLIWFIMQKLSVPGAFLAALIFAVHPVNVESVAWISQQKNMFAMLFFLLSILCYLHYIQRARPWLAAKQTLSTVHYPLSTFSSPSSFYWLSLAMFILAMLSKGSVAVLPIILLGIVWWMRGLTRWDWVKMVPFFLVAAIFTCANLWFRTHGEAVTIRNADFLQRLLGAPAAVWFYLYKAVLPIDLAFVYPQWNIQAGKLIWWLPMLAAMRVTAVLLWYGKTWARPLLFAWGFFCAALVPVMGFTDVGFMKYSLVADHYQHIAIIAVISLVAAGLDVWRVRARPMERRIAITLSILAVGVLGVLTWRQNALYSDRIELYRTTLEKNPACWMAHNNLGKALYESGLFQEAMDHYKQAMSLKSDYPEVFYNMGLVLSDMNRYQEAIEQYERALHINPKLPQAHNNLGVCLLNMGRPQEATPHYQEALRIRPNYPEAQNNLGTSFFLAGRLQDAIECFEQALRLQGDYADAHFNLGIALAKTGRLQDAIKHYKQATQLNPGDFETYYNLALAYAETGRSPEAIKATLTAIELARSQEKTDRVKQMEDWLNSYRGQGKK